MSSIPVTAHTEKLNHIHVNVMSSITLDPDPFCDSGRWGMLLHSLEATAKTTASLFVNCNQNNRLVYWVGSYLQRPISEQNKGQPPSQGSKCLWDPLVSPKHQHWCDLIQHTTQVSLKVKTQRKTSHSILFYSTLFILTLMIIFILKEMSVQHRDNWFVIPMVVLPCHCKNIVKNYTKFSPV